MTRKAVRPPLDFAVWCVKETIDELRVRYRKGAETINRWISVMSEEVQQQRREAITERWRQNGRGRPPGDAIREPVSVPHLVPPPPVMVTDEGQRRRDRQFVEHYTRVASRHGWALWPSRNGVAPAPAPAKQVAL